MFQDEVFYKAVKNTLLFCVVTVTANIVLTLFLAKIISVIPSRGIRTFFRTVSFIPCIAPKNWGLTTSLEKALIVPSMFSVFSIYLAKQFVKGLALSGMK